MDMSSSPAKRGPSSPKIIVDSSLTKDSSAIRPTPVKPVSAAIAMTNPKDGSVSSLDHSARSSPGSATATSKNKIVVKQIGGGSRSGSDEMLVPERDTNNEITNPSKESNGNCEKNGTNDSAAITTNNVTNVVVGSDSPADSGYQILSR